MRPAGPAQPSAATPTPVGQRLLLVVAIQVSRRCHESRIGPAAQQHPAFLLCDRSDGGVQLWCQWFTRARSRASGQTITGEPQLPIPSC